MDQQSNSNDVNNKYLKQKGQSELVPTSPIQHSGKKPNYRMKSMSALSEIKSVGPPNIQNIISPSVNIRYPSTLQTSKMR